MQAIKDNIEALKREQKKVSTQIKSTAKKEPDTYSEDQPFSMAPPEGIHETPGIQEFLVKPQQLLAISLDDIDKDEESLKYNCKRYSTIMKEQKQREKENQIPPEQLKAMKDAEKEDTEVKKELTKEEKKQKERDDKKASDELAAKMKLTPADEEELSKLEGRALHERRYDIIQAKLGNKTWKPPKEVIQVRDDKDAAIT